MSNVNKTQLNKLRAQIEKNKLFLSKSLWGKESEDKQYSAAVSMSVLAEYFNLDQTTGLDSVTDGQYDNKFDAIYFSDDEDELSELIIIQSKYKRTDGDTSTFTEDEIKICIGNCEKILSGENFSDSNLKITDKLKDYRDLLNGSNNPGISIKLFFATNGIIHAGHKVIKEIKDASENNIDVIFIDATFFGKNIVLEDGQLEINTKNSSDKTDSIFDIEDNLYSGAIVSCSIENLMIFYKECGEKYLLNNNVRYLLRNSLINKEIKKSFLEDPIRFSYLNNGISITCNSFEIEQTGFSFNKIKFVKPNIVNGGQTIATLYEIYTSTEEKYKNEFKKAKILIRVYKTPEDFRIKIAQATNSQNPINIVDLKSNDPAQKIVKDFFEKEAICLICKDGEDVTYSDDTITNESLLQMYASIFLNDPAKAKLSKASIFKRYYAEVFNNSIDENICKKLLKCYYISKYIKSKKNEDKVLISNAFYSIAYTMKNIDSNILNSNIPSKKIETLLDKAFASSLEIIKTIVIQKQLELSTKFSLNNLFKGTEIKDLIDIKMQIK